MAGVVEGEGEQGHSQPAFGRSLAALSAAGVAVCAGAVALTLSGSQSSNPTLDAEIRAAIIAAPIAVGLYAWYREPWARFGKLLVAAGFAWSLTTLAQSNNEVLYSAGRVFGWLVEPLLIYLVLAFPSGRLTTRVGADVWSPRARCSSLVFYLPTMLLVDSYPTPSPWSSCDANCPANAFMLVGSEPGFVGDVILPFRETRDHAAVRGRDRGARARAFGGARRSCASRSCPSWRLRSSTRSPSLRAS